MGWMLLLVVTEVLSLEEVTVSEMLPSTTEPGYRYIRTSDHRFIYVNGKESIYDDWNKQYWVDVYDKRNLNQHPYTLSPPGGYANNDYWFGDTISSNGRYLVIGARKYNNITEYYSGAVFIYNISDVSSSNTGVPQFHHIATISNSTEKGFVGGDVVIDADNVIYTDTLGLKTMYVFELNIATMQWEKRETIMGSGWRDLQFAKLSTAGDTFALKAKTVMGFVRKVQIYSRTTNSSWVVTQTLNPPQDPTCCGDDWFGFPIRMYKSIMLVAASHFSISNKLQQAGLVYLYVKDNNGTWTERLQLVNPEPAGFTFFGRNLHVDEKYVYISWRRVATMDIGVTYIYQHGINATNGQDSKEDVDIPTTVGSSTTSYTTQPPTTEQTTIKVQSSSGAPTTTAETVKTTEPPASSEGSSVAVKDWRITAIVVLLLLVVHFEN